MASNLTLGDKISRLREGSKISQTQLANYLKLDQSMISKMENNERVPGIEVLEKITFLFACPSDYFLEDSDSFSPFQIAFRANDINQSDLEAIASINRIALNLRDMTQLIRGESL